MASVSSDSDPELVTGEEERRYVLDVTSSHHIGFGRKQIEGQPPEHIGGEDYDITYKTPC